MKSVSILLCMFLFAACVNNEVFDGGPIGLTSAQSDSLLAKYLIVEDELYALSISKEDAERQGVSAEAYDMYCGLLEDVNQTLIDAREQGIPVYGMGKSDDISLVMREELGNSSEHSRVGWFPYQSLIGELTLNSGIDVTSTSFQGSSSFYVNASSDAMVPWVVVFIEKLNNKGFGLTGYPGMDAETLVGSGKDYAYWAWDVYRRENSDCNINFKFYGVNCLSIKGEVPPEIRINTINNTDSNYTVEVKNMGPEVVYYRFRWGISEERKLEAGQSIVFVSNYGIPYTLDFRVGAFEYLGIQIYMDRAYFIN